MELPEDKLREIVITELDRVDSKYQSAVLGVATLMLAYRAKAVPKEVIVTLIGLFADSVNDSQIELIEDARKVLEKYFESHK